MEEPKCECNEPEQDLSETLSAFWGNLLERIKDRAESQSGWPDSESHGAQDFSKARQLFPNSRCCVSLSIGERHPEASIVVTDMAKYGRCSDCNAEPTVDTWPL